MYLAVFVLATLPGLSIGFVLFGRSHAAGWLTGGVMGYAVTGVLQWLAVQLGVSGWPALSLIWLTSTALLLVAPRRVSPQIRLAAWTRRDTLALVLVLFMVPALLWKPLTNIGITDEQGNHRYRAYFTADFLWHVALTAELAKAQSPPRNPYLARRPLHYYWAYFVLPATISRTHLLPSTQTYLTINALCAGLLFVSMIFVAAWSIVPRAGPVAIAVVVTVLAASAEGFYALVDLWRHGRPFAQVTNLNIDAITSWFFQSQTIDSLPRSLWYTPQHAMSCGLGLIAMIVASARDLSARLTASLVAGFPLGLALIFSPFLGGVFSLMFGLAALTAAVSAHRGATPILRDLARTSVAAVPVLAALGWCLASGTFEGAGGNVAIGPSARAAAAPIIMPLLSIGPVLVPAIFGMVVGAWRWPLH